VNDPPLIPEETVLVDEGVPDEFHDAVRALGSEWTAPSGRRYGLVLAGRRLVVTRPASQAFAPAESGEEVDQDLLALGQALYEARGGDWAAVRLEQLALVWSGANRRDLA
jgi:hypothetical protein